jgi:hypothetical protein
MKKKAIPTAQMGRSNIQRRAYKSAGYTTPKADAKKAESKPAETKPTFSVPTPSKPKSDGYDDYMKTVQGESFKISAPKEEKKQASATKKIVRTKSEPLVTKDSRKSEISSLKTIKAPTKGIQKGPEKRKFSDSEVKIMNIMKKGEKKDGTMKESAQRKIQAVRTKERLATQKIRNKAERAEKRYEVKSAKVKVKAVRKSFKK